MRCAVIRKEGPEVENLEIEQRADLEPSGEYIRVQVTATALNRADLLQRRGLYPAPPGTPPEIPGLEFVGYVDRIGDQVTAWKGGERVFGIVPGGSYAEQVITHQRLAVRVPEELSDTEAAAVPEAFISAHDALVTQGGMRSGDLVLLHAVTGGVGSAALQIVHLFGARAAGTAGSEEKIDRVRKLAPFHAINYKKEEFQASIEGAYGRDAVDLVLDTVGARYWKSNLAVLRERGTLVLFGLLGGVKAETNLGLLLLKRLRIVATTLRSRPLEDRILATQAFARQVLPHLEGTRLLPVLDSVFPFHELHEATRRMELNENTGKIVLTLT